MHRLFNLSSVFICLMAMLLLYVTSSTANACVNYDGMVIELGSVDIEVDNLITDDLVNSDFFSIEEYPIPFEKDKVEIRHDENLFTNNVECYLKFINKSITGKKLHTNFIIYHKEALGVFTLSVFKLPIIGA